MQGDPRHLRLRDESLEDPIHRRRRVLSRPMHRPAAGIGRCTGRDDQTSPRPRTPFRCVTTDTRGCLSEHGSSPTTNADLVLGGLFELTITFVEDLIRCSRPPTLAIWVAGILNS